jgi:large subunit ribosomal protein L9
MELILLQDIDNLGLKYEIVNVKPGYGRNFLIPKGMAQIANASNKKHHAEIQKQRSAKVAKMMEETRALAAKLSETKLVIGAKAGTSGKLFGSVTNIQISDAIKNATDLDVDRKKIHISQEIKELGTYKAVVTLYKDITSEITFEVVQD